MGSVKTLVVEVSSVGVIMEVEWIVVEKVTVNVRLVAVIVELRTVLAVGWMISSAGSEVLSTMSKNFGTTLTLSGPSRAPSGLSSHCDFCVTDTREESYAC